jgi:hypothetical protein
MTNPIAVERGIRIWIMSAPIGRYHAKIVEQFDELNYLSWGLDQLYWVGIVKEYARDAARCAVH